MWWKRHKWNVIAAVAAAAVLAFAFWYGGDSPGLRGWKGSDPALSAEPAPSDAPAPPAAPDLPAMPDPGPPDLGPPAPDGSENPPQGQETPPAEPPAGENPPAVNADPPVPAESPASPAGPEPPAGPEAPVSPEDPGEPEEPVCTLSVSCAAVFDHPDWLEPGKEEILPADGVIYPETSLMFSPGETVFDLLKRALREAGIPMEFSQTPMYQSAYVEGIGNLYEFDCGELSGWLYQVNGERFGYGSSQRQLEPGDRVEWLFTCDRGAEPGA